MSVLRERRHPKQRSLGSVWTDLRGSSERFFAVRKIIRFALKIAGIVEETPREFIAPDCSGLARKLPRAFAQLCWFRQNIYAT